MCWKLDTAYVSEDEKFLRAADARIPLSASQKKEMKKHERIAELRDHAEASVDEASLWEAF